VITRRRLVAAALAGSVCAAVGARADEDPRAPIANLNDALLTAIKLGASTPFSQRFGVIAPAVDTAFDLPAILRAVVGLRWSRLDDKDALLAEFRRYTVANFAANFTDGTFRLGPDVKELGADRIVHTEFVAPDGDPTPLDYVMRTTPAGWRAVDILADGTISRVAVQRSDFRNAVEGGAPALMAVLRAKVKDLSGGTIGDA
jgi:phospholipid transport system substrate-binding protein